MLEPLLEIENYVNTNLQVSEDWLRFFFAVRAEGPVSLALFLYHMLRSRVRFSGLDEAARLKALTPLLSKISAIDPSLWQPTAVMTTCFASCCAPAARRKLRGSASPCTTPSMNIWMS